MNDNRAHFAIVIVLGFLIFGSLFLGLSRTKSIIALQPEEYALVAPTDNASATTSPFLYAMPKIGSGAPTAIGRILVYGKTIPLWLQLMYLGAVLFWVYSKEVLKTNKVLPSPRRWLPAGLLVYAATYAVIMVLAKEEMTVYSFVMAFSFGFSWRGFTQL